MYKLERETNGEITTPRKWTEKVTLMGLALLPILKTVAGELDSALHKLEDIVRVNLLIYSGELLSSPPKCAKHRSKYVCAVVLGDILPFLCEDEECSVKLLEAMELFDTTRKYKKIVEILKREEEKYNVNVEEVLSDIVGLVDKEQCDFLNDIGLSYTFQSVFPHDPWPSINVIKVDDVHVMLRDMRNPNNYGFSFYTENVRQISLTARERQHYVTVIAQHSLDERTKAMGVGFPQIVYTGGHTPDASSTALSIENNVREVDELSEEEERDDDQAALAHPHDNIDDLDAMTDEE